MTDQTPYEIDTPTADDLGKCVSGLVNAVARGMEQQLAAWRLSALEFSILGVCLSAGTTTVTGLSNVIPVDSGRISRIINKLHERGLINRERMTSDRRVVKLRLSEEGRDLVPRLVKLVEDYNQMLISGISPDNLTRFVATSHMIMSNYARHMAELAADDSNGAAAPA